MFQGNGFQNGFTYRLIKFIVGKKLMKKILIFNIFNLTALLVNPKE